MKIFTFILFIILPYSQSFNCLNIDKEFLCEATQGCNWSNDTNKCSGVIKELTFCQNSKCIFIWDMVNSTKGDQNGSLSKPYCSFARALKSLDSSIDYYLIGINLNALVYELKNHKFGQQTIKILPFFEKERLNLRYYPQNDSSILLSNSTKLSLENINLFINFTGVPQDQNISIFSDENKNQEKSECQLRLKNINITASPRENTYTDSQLANFTFCDFQIMNSTLTGIQALKIIKLSASETIETKPKVQIKNFTQIFQMSNQIFSAENANIQIDNYQILKNSSSTESSKLSNYLFFIQSSILNVHNFNISQTDTNIFYLQDTLINFNKSTFQDNVAQKIINLPPLTKKNINRANFTNISFKRVRVDQQILYFGANAKLSHIKMNEILFRYPSLNSYVKSSICLLSYFSKIEIEYSSFSKFQSTCIFLHYSSIDITNTIFYGNLMYPNSLDDDIIQNPQYSSTISSSIIDVGESKYVPASAFPYKQEISVIRTQFVAFSNFINDGGAFTTSSQRQSKRSIQIADCSFVGIFATNRGGSIYLNIYETATIQNSIFSNQGYKNEATNLTHNGGALLLYNSLIETCLFTNLQSRIYGGVIESGNNILKNNIFHQNSASFGGVISTSYQGISFEGANYFIFNQAKVRGGAIFYSNQDVYHDKINSTYPNFDQTGLSFQYTTKIPGWTINTYQFNSNWNLIGRKNQNFSKLIESGIFQKNQTINSLMNEGSRPFINVSYKFENYYSELIEVILNENGTNQTNDNFNGLQLCLTLVFYDRSVLEECEDIKSGKAYFTGFDMDVSVPNITKLKNHIKDGTDGTLDMRMGSEQGFKPTFLVFRTVLEFCEEGDRILNLENGICEPCPQYTYSLKVPKSLNDTCLPCPDNMICAGGNDVLPLPGYYRPSLSSTKAVECLNEMACIGGIKEDQIISQSGFCNDKFSGVLCSQCESGYIPTQNSSSCIECENDVLFYLKMIGMMIITLGVVLVQIYLKFRTSRRMASAYQKNDKNLLENIEKTNSFSNSFKIIVTLFQMISIIKAINFQWITSLKYFYNLSSDILPTIVRQFAQKCLLVFFGVDSRFMQYYQYIMILSTPFINLFWISIIAILYFLIKRRGRRSENSESFEQFNFKSVLFQAIIILFYIYQPSILIETFNLFSCRQLGDKYYFIQNLDVECYDSTYFKWVISLGIPSLIFWAVVIPILVYSKISKEFKSASQDGDQELNLFRSKYAFVVSSYKNEYYYWEFLISLSKIGMILLVSILSQSDNMTQGIVVSIIIGLSMYLQLKFNPYKNESLSKLDRASMIAILVMIQLGMYMENETIIKNSQIVTNNVFIIYFLSLIGALLLIYCCLLFIELVYQAFWGKVMNKVNNIWKGKESSTELQDSTMVSKKQSEIVL